MAPDTIEHMFDTQGRIATVSGPATSAAVPAGLESAAPGEELARLLSEVRWDRLAPQDLVVVSRA